MTSEPQKISKAEALLLAKQQHVPVQEFLNQEPTRTDLLQGLINKRDEDRKLILLTCLLGAEKPVSAKYFDWPKSTTSIVAKDLDTYLREFSGTIGPLKAKRKKICIPRQEGGLSVGYHFACLNNKSNECLDGAATERLLENLWDDFIRKELHKKLEQEAKDELSKKLQGRDDYQALDMEIGVVPQKTKNEISESMKSTESKTYGHNRVWESFNIESLFKSSDTSPYIISVDAGGGKTTFLRYLQLEFLRKSEIIPVFLDASKIEEWRLENSYQLAEKLVVYFDLNLCKNRVLDFLIRALKEEIILLVDGLDQIRAGGNEYECLANHVLDLMGKNVIISSRPSAAINHEDENQFTFLRLKPFDTNAQENYFGDNFERAKQLSMNASYLIAIPMLAHMVRMLIEEKQDGNINNRAELYKEFINYILTKYKHGKARLKPGLRTQIGISLERIAYDALDEEKPYIQKIPLRFCYDKGRLPNNSTLINDDLLTKSGLANLIIERSGWRDEDFLFFTHQSFQEYLAAEYIKDSKDMIEQVLSEKWNPKWKETIKFLTGIKGPKIIGSILEENDNPIHSNLFLAAELITETEIDLILANKISEKIKALLDCSMCYEEARNQMLNIDQEKAMLYFLDDGAVDYYKASIEAINACQNETDEKILEPIRKLKKIHSQFCNMFKSQSKNKETLDLSYIGAKQTLESFLPSETPIHVLGLKSIRGINDIKQIVDFLEEKTSIERECALWLIDEIRKGSNADLQRYLVKELIASKNSTAYSLLKKMYKDGKLEFLKSE